MEFGEITQVIGTLGFPIVMCFLMAKFIKNIIDRLLASLSEIKEVMNEHTKAIEGLCKEISDLKEKSKEA